MAQYGTTNGEWRVNGGDAGSTRYSPLDQINATNVKNLQVVLRWKAQNMGPSPQAAWEVTPLMVGGKLYVTAGTGRTVVAIDAATGETLWLYNGDDTKERGAVRANQSRPQLLERWARRRPHPVRDARAISSSR